MYSPSHRPASIASSPSPQQYRRMSSPVPPPAPLGLPEPGKVPSPLRKAIPMDPESEDGSSDADDPDTWGTRDRYRDHDGESHLPSPSITKLASSFAQRVGSLVTSVPPHLPTEAELEAEAALQRERSRREAERILLNQQAAAERKKVEERVLEMLEASRTSSPARPRSQTVPASPNRQPTSPTKEGGSWWSTAMNKLTPTKADRDLTPAQQLVKDTKAREKESRRRSSKEPEWPTNAAAKHRDPAFQQLALPPGARPPGGQVGGGANVPLPPSPGSPSPRSSQPVKPLTESPSAARQPGPPLSPYTNISPNPGTRSMQRPNTASSEPSTSSGREPPPIYAQFSSQGILDTPATLLTIARRFEKLERWAVGHTRALEERMSDVEKWLVDKERERERDRESASASIISTATLKPHPQQEEKDSVSPQQVVREVTIERKTVEVDQEVKREVGEIKEELGELRSRVGELGREMARLASSVPPTTPSEASGFGIGRIASPPADTPARSPSPRTLPAIPPQAPHRQSPSAHSIAHSETASIVSSETGPSGRTKLPYPSGDYTSPPAPPPSHTPPAAQTYANNASSAISRTRPLSYSGIPIPQSSFPSTTSPALTRPSNVRRSPAPPALPVSRNITTSPSPRKRYTVALGQPLSSSSSPSLAGPTNDPPVLALDEKQNDFGGALFAEPQTVELQTAFFTDVPGKIERRRDEEDADDDGAVQEEKEGGHGADGKEGATSLKRQETIGKTPITLSRLSLSPPPSQDSSPNNKTSLQRSSPRPSPSYGRPRPRPQSTYGVPGAASTASLSTLGGPNTPPDGRDTWRTRSRSIDRVGLGIEGLGGSSFVDPLIVRKKEKDMTIPRTPVVASPGGPRGRVPFGDLLAFFDGEKQ